MASTIRRSRKRTAAAAFITNSGPDASQSSGPSNLASSNQRSGKHIALQGDEGDDGDDDEYVAPKRARKDGRHDVQQFKVDDDVSFLHSLPFIAQQLSRPPSISKVGNTP